MKSLYLFILMTLITTFSWAQTQKAKGVILDTDTQAPLVGATITVLSSDPVIGTSTDVDGKFTLENIPIGRQSFAISYLGYESQLLSNVMVISGKELALTILLVESAETLDQVVVSSKQYNSQPLNELAGISARSFTVEETERYASSFYDPSRMAQNFAGVSIAGSSDDLYNEIIVRGNSPRGIMWRLEGIEIPNPNHFGQMGNSGGAISMLSSSTLATSDFFTGAFPAEYGNAYSGVFDLNLRTGNSEKNEYAFMIGLLGIEASAEGPLSKENNSSFLFNYRYSTLAAMEDLGLSPVEDVLPVYQDLSFKINFPFKKGSFSLFGLGGQNSNGEFPESDSTLWKYSNDKYGFEERQLVGTLGASYKQLISDKTYLKTITSISYDKHISNDFHYNSEENFREEKDFVSKFNNTNFRINSSLTTKINNKNTLKAGFEYHKMGYKFNAVDFYNSATNPEVLFDNKGNSSFFQAFGHWKNRLDQKWTLNSGVHFNYFALNGKYSIEPRLSVEYQIDNRQTVSLAGGLHSKPDHISFYFVETTSDSENRNSPNKDLDYIKSFHSVIGYNRQLSSSILLQVEAYYQHLFDVPMEGSFDSYKSIINALDIWDIIRTEESSNGGKGTNAGIDMSLEKQFTQGYYFTLSGSLFDSKFENAAGQKFNTRYNSNFHLNSLFGKEFKMGKGKKNILGLNAKLLYSGGNRDTPIDFQRSQQEQKAVYKYDQFNEIRLPDYFRADIGISYKINRPKITHTIKLDVQNASNNENIYNAYYSVSRNEINYNYQTSLFPVVNYRIEF
jgi:hypothetical protein